MRQAEFSDQLGNTIVLSFPPKRIISLVPSQTELLHFLGLEKETVGITKFCELPADWFAQKAKVGGTKNFWFETIDTLSPDLIIGNKEENYQEGIARLQAQYPVWISDIISWDDAMDMITRVGVLTDRSAQANQLVRAIHQSFRDLEKLPPLRTLYLIWYQPWMAAAADTFINNMLQLAGLRNVLHNESRYPELTPETIVALDPELILLSSEPFPFSQKHRAELTKWMPNAKLVDVDGKVFSWYGSRLLHAADYFRSLATQLAE